MHTGRTVRRLTYGVVPVVVAGLALAVGPTDSAAAAAVNVSAQGTALFSDSKVYVRKGEKITVTASGTWRHKLGTFGPGGHPNLGTGQCRIGQLAGRVGLYGRTRCFTSSAVSFTSDAEGYLLLFMNDGPGTGGALSVTVDGGDTASGRPASLPRPPVGKPGTFAKRCDPPFTFRNEDPSGGKVFTDEVPDVAAWFRGIARDVCARLYKTAAEARTVNSVKLFLRNCPGVAGKSGDRDIVVQVCTPHLNNVKKAGQSVEDEVTGIMEHEVTHGYQQDDKPDSNPPIGIIEGVADAVRLSAGYISPGAVGTGGNWDFGYKTTAFFLVWLDTQYSQFLYRFNQSFKPNGAKWGPGEFKKITGKSVDQLWSEYQKAIRNI